MITIIAIDALEHTLVERWDVEQMKQKFYGRTDITEFSEPRTMVLWSSFITGKNKEKEVLALGDKDMWNYRTPHEDTFFSHFDDPKVIDLPGYNYDLQQHERERKLLKKFFTSQDQDEKKRVRKSYNSISLKHHKKVKDEFYASLEGGHDLLLGYFSAADVVGHLNFGDEDLMGRIYKDMASVIKKAKKARPGPAIVLSDHGMEALGAFGDHSGYGFWSTNYKDLGTPKITDFCEIITKKMKKD